MLTFFNLTSIWLGGPEGIVKDMAEKICATIWFWYDITMSPKASDKVTAC